MIEQSGNIEKDVDNSLKNLSLAIERLIQHAQTRQQKESLLVARYEIERIMRVNSGLNYRYLATEQENRQLRRQLNSRFHIEDIVGQSTTMEKVRNMVKRAAHTNSNVLITGESGSGKELAARVIHSLSARSDKEFYHLNCAVTDDASLQRELFGADDDSAGLLGMEHEGTLFLDEVDSLSPASQAELVTVFERKQAPVPCSSVAVDRGVRIIAASKKDMIPCIRQGLFREDLYYRLNVVGIDIPPLRQRKEDIPLLVRHFIAKYSAEQGKFCDDITADAMRVLKCYSWKGNIRQMQNVIERAVIFADGAVVRSSDIGLPGSEIIAAGESGFDLNSTVKVFQREQILKALDAYQWNKVQAARALGIGLSSLYRKMDECDISRRRSNR